MAKETFWFSHDFSSRNDPKIQKLNRKHGMSGIGLFWCIVEILHEQEGYLMESDCEDFAYSLRVDVAIFMSVLTEFGLFQRDETRFWSNSCLQRIQIRQAKANNAQESARIRWEKEAAKKAAQIELYANALPEQTDSNAIKEKKRKERIDKREREDQELFAAADAATQSRFKAFKDWLKLECPRVEQMKEPFRFSQWQKATEEFGKFGDTLKEMHNYNPLLQKNVSAYYTLCKWRKNNFNK